MSPRGRLRVLHVLPYQVPGQDETDALRVQLDNDVPTSDFWFNHWQVRYHVYFYFLPFPTLLFYCAYFVLRYLLVEYS